MVFLIFFLVKVKLATMRNQWMLRRTKSVIAHELPTKSTGL